MRGPNQPCECGSGRKQKKCHPSGAPVEGPAKEPKPEKVSVNTGLITAMSLFSLFADHGFPFQQRPF